MTAKKRKPPAATRQGEPPAPAGTRLSGFAHWDWVLLAAVIVFVAAIRIRLLQMPFERDEGEYAYAGQLILQGIPPYKLAYNMKFPGIYAAYALIMAVFGQTVAGVHLGVLVANAGAIVLAFLLARRLFGRTAGVVAGATYGALSASPSVLGLAGHATHFVVLCALGAILLMLRGTASGKPAAFFWSGLLLGLAVLMKQAGALFVPFAVCFVVWHHLRKRPTAWAGAAKDTALLVLGAVLPFGLTCLVLYKTGVLGTFWFWTFKYAREYVSQMTLAYGFANLTENARSVIGPFGLIWVLAAIGLAAVIWDSRARSNAFFVIAFAVFSFLAVCPGLYFRHHYFILFLPAVALLTGVAVGSVEGAISRAYPSRALRTMPALVFAAILICSVSKQGDYLFRMPAAEACRATYGLNPFPESIEIANYVRRHTSSADTIAVIGSEPQIYFYSHRHSATGHIYTYGLMERQPYALQMQKQMIREIEAARPEYMVFVSCATSWLKQRESVSLIFNWFNRYCTENYEVVGIADIAPSGMTTYYWDDETRNISPSSESYICVFRRKTSR